MNRHYFDFLRCDCTLCRRMRRNPIHTLLSFFKRELSQYSRQAKVRERGNKKIFILGQNKTGTTSLNHYLKLAGFIPGEQRRFELETDNVIHGKYGQAKKLIDVAESFQDVPFSYASISFLDFLTSTYPDAFFILNTRDSEEWYQSCIRFYRKIWFRHHNKITWDDLDGLDYHGGTTILKNRVKRSFSSPFEKEPFLHSFNMQNKKIDNYFASRPHLKYLKTDVTSRNFDSSLIAEFLDIANPPEFPHLNQTK